MQSFWSYFLLFVNMLTCTLMSVIQNNIWSAVNFYPRDVVSAVYATTTWLAGWLGGCLSVTGRYCMAKDILKLF